jgi:hypothetical protein
MSVMVFTNFGCLFVKKTKNKFLLAFMKIVPVTVLRKLALAFQWLIVTLKVVPKASCGPETCSGSQPGYVYSG